MLNDGTKYSEMVKTYYPKAFCRVLHEGTNTLHVIWAILVPSKQEWNGELSIVGRGKTPWLAWKNAGGYIERAMLRKLES